MSARPAREQELRDFLGRFRFTGEMVQQPVGSLSGGEKARLVLAMLVWQRPNLLLLDEPTNHLDLTTREALSIALNEFEGTVHAGQPRPRAAARGLRRVLAGRGGPAAAFRRRPRRLPEVAARGVARLGARGCRRRPGRARRPRRNRRRAGARGETPKRQSAASRDDRRADKQQRALLAQRTRPLRVELQQADARLARLAAEKAEVDAALADGSARPDAFAELGRRAAHIAAETHHLEERWLALHAELEDIGKTG